MNLVVLDWNWRYQWIYGFRYGKCDCVYGCVSIYMYVCACGFLSCVHWQCLGTVTAQQQWTHLMSKPSLVSTIFQEKTPGLWNIGQVWGCVEKVQDEPTSCCSSKPGNNKTKQQQQQQQMMKNGKRTWSQLQWTFTGQMCFIKQPSPPQIFCVIINKSSYLKYIFTSPTSKMSYTLVQSEA